jgi:PBP1b-binding outer membrane lipoprotein LpoB
MKKYFAMTAIALAVVGCASNPNKMTEVKEAPKSSAASTSIPEWFVQGPPADGKDIIVTATDTSREMQFAIDKAMMNARVELASRMNIKVQSMIRESVTEDGAGKMKDVEREVDRVSKLVTNQTLSMYTRDKLIVVKEDDGFRAYVMLKLNVDQSRRLIDNTRKSSRDRDDKFDELEQSVEKDNGKGKKS